MLDVPKKTKTNYFNNNNNNNNFIYYGFNVKHAMCAIIFF